MLYMRISTRNVACSQRQMHTCIHHSVTHTTCEHTTRKQGSRTSDEVIRLALEKKTDAVNAYLKKNSKGEVEKEKKKKRRVGQRGSTLTNSRKDWVEFYGRIK